MTRLIMVFIASIAAITAYAEQGSDADRAAKAKEMRLQGIDGRLTALQQERSCVQAATTRDALKACEKTAHQAMKDLAQKQKSRWESQKSK